MYICLCQLQFQFQNKYYTYLLQVLYIFLRSCELKATRFKNDVGNVLVNYYKDWKLKLHLLYFTNIWHVYEQFNVTLDTYIK